MLKNAILKNAILILGIILNLSLFADASFGEKLEVEMWNNFKEHNWSAVRNQIAPYCLVAALDSLLDKDDEMQQLKNLDIKDFTLSNFTVTEGKDVYVVTYDVAVAETINDKRYFSKATRLSVWHKNNGTWQWASHSLLIPTSTDEMP